MRAAFESLGVPYFDALATVLAMPPRKNPVDAASSGEPGPPKKPRAKRAARTAVPSPAPAAPMPPAQPELLVDTAPLDVDSDASTVVAPLSPRAPDLLSTEAPVRAIIPELVHAAPPAKPKRAPRRTNKRVAKAEVQPPAAAPATDLAPEAKAAPAVAVAEAVAPEVVQHEQVTRAKRAKSSAEPGPKSYGEEWFRDLAADGLASAKRDLTNRMSFYPPPVAAAAVLSR